MGQVPENVLEKDRERDMQDEVSGFRLSPQQKRIWSLGEGAAVYRAACRVLLEGKLDASVLRQALSNIVQRHEIFRTTFRRIPGVKTPLQFISDEVAFGWRHLKQDDANSPWPEAGSDEYLEAEMRQPWNYEQEPCLRATVLSFEPDRHLLQITLPSLCADAETLKIIVREISLEYAAGAACAPPDEEPLPYLSFAEWQNALLESEEAVAGREFWRKSDNLNVTAAVTLPLEAVNFNATEFQTAFLSRPLPGEVGKRIDEVVEKYHTTHANFLLACWQLLLWRLTHQTEIVVGVAFDGRKFESLAQTCGQLSKCLPVRALFESEMSFGQLLSQLDNATRQADDWQDFFTWEQGVKIAGRDEEISYLPLAFEFLNGVSTFNARDVRISLLGLQACFDRFKIKLSCVRLDDALAAEFQYDPQLLHANDVERLAGQFAALVQSALDNPEGAIDRLPMLGDQERHQLLVEWNETDAEYPAERCFHELFAEQASRTPDAVAVTYGEQHLTFRQLDEQANQLAHYLISLGVNTDAPVALLLPRSPDLLVSLLAILKAGAAYLPIELNLPAPRILFMLEDARPRLLIAESSLLERVELPQCVRLIDPQAAREQINSSDASLPTTRVSPDGLAYVIYTSGSTGNPKGVMVPHRSLVNYLHWGRRFYQLEAGAAAPVHSPLSFDLTVTSLLMPLLAGGRVELLDEAAGVEGLLESLREGTQGSEQLSVVKMTPSHLEMLSRLWSADGEGVRPVGVLVVGGEALHWKAVRWWRQHWPQCRVINEYGPTETTVGSVVQEAGATGEGDVPIGKPIANTEVYVLDERMQPVPVGVWGELYIGGDGVARGYLNRPHLTAERFVPHPFSREAGARLYRTGDVVRYLETGELEFGGRSDAQVKVRGYRVELGEVEAALSGHAGVRECVVVVRADAGGDKRLVAYVVAEAEQRQGAGETGAGEWRRYLKERLPEHMIPGVFVELEELPLTPNGKVDRRALPEPEQNQMQATVAMSGQQTVVEEVMTAIWMEVLMVSQVGKRDNFFELGGHSLLATQLISRIRETFHVEITLRELFDAPTVAGLAASVERAMGTEQGGGAPPITRASRERNLPLSFAQQRLWFLDQLEPGSSFYNVPVGVKLEGTLNVAVLEQTLVEIMRRHEVLRTHFSVVDNQPVQLTSATQPFKLSLIDLSDLAEGERDEAAIRLTHEEAERPFNLAEGPLLRVTLLRLGEEEHVCLLTMHHIVSDGWSSAILIREVAVLYQTFMRGEASPLPELEIQYADYAVWQREWLQGEVLEAHLDYWREQLKGAPPVLEIPTDRPHPAVQSYRGACEFFTLSEELSSKVRRLSRREGATLFMTLLAAFQALLSRYSRQKDIVVGTPIAGRTRREIEPLIGFFLNTLTLRTSLEDDPSFRELLRRVREVCLGAYTHQELPFEMLVEQLQPRRSLSYSPIFQVMFVLQNNPRENLELPELTLSSVYTSSESSKFDLTLFVIENGDGVLTGYIEYSTALFDRDTIERMIGHFENLLEGFVANPEQAITAIPLLSSEERRRVLVEWNDTAVESSTPPVHVSFEAQVERTPDKVAVVFEDRQLSYAELNAHANRVAHRLRALGVGTDSLVGLSMNRSLEMVVGVLGILKAGGAYVPLDPAYPAERLSFMLQDAGARVLVTQRQLLGILPTHDLQVVCLDAEDEKLAAENTDNLLSGVRPDHLAYVIFTSGSTGRPKGVALSHGALANLIKWDSTVLARGARTLQFASVSFDVSFLEIFSTWCSGGTLFVATDELRLDVNALAHFFSQTSIEKVTLPVVVLQQLAENYGTQPELFRGLSEIVTTGEQLRITSPIVGLFKQLKGCALHNYYGPSESHVVTAYALGDAPEQWPSHPPIGRPIANTQIYITDTHFHPVPVGLPGELFIGGVMLARGYVNRPELTAEKFIPDPFSPKPGARMYRTGDLARFLPDGNIEYLGRIDHQVKVRGFRVELGEVESVLARHEAVQEAVALVHEDEAGDKLLVAYLVVEGEAEGLAAELRKYLRTSLPEYMIPNVFILLDRFPLTTNGKVDRRALPTPARTRAGTQHPFVAPRTPAEEVVAAVWMQTLRVEQVSINDDFFELGGHSLLATQVISRLRDSFQMERLSLQSIFASPTVAGLVEVLSNLWGSRETVEEIAGTLQQLEQLSADEVELILSEDNAQT